MNPKFDRVILLATVAVAALALGGAIAACKDADVPRELARGTVLTLAHAVHVADITCATIAVDKEDAELATTCADAYDVARSALLGAESAVDAWDAGAAGDVSCSVSRGAAALVSIAAAIRSAGGIVPPVVDDALRLSPVIAGVCRG